MHHFAGGADAAHPQGGLLVPGSGYFGVSQAGGTSGAGTVFLRNADGSVTLRHGFNALDPHTGTNSEGAGPSGALANSGSTLAGRLVPEGQWERNDLYRVDINGEPDSPSARNSPCSIREYGHQCRQRAAHGRARSIKRETVRHDFGRRARRQRRDFLDGIHRCQLHRALSLRADGYLDRRRTPMARCHAADSSFPTA